MKKYISYFMSFSWILIPSIVLAQEFGSSKIKANLDSVTAVLNALITLLILLATFLFLWGIVKYITAGGDEEKIKEARGYIIWGIIFLAVMVAVWGFVNILLDFVFGKQASDFKSVPVGPQQ